MRVAVIGGGACGLATAKTFKEICIVDVYERSHCIGGTWMYSEEISSRDDVGGLDFNSSMYQNLVTNLPKEVMAFPDFPFTKQSRSFVGHKTVYDYLVAYARHFDILSLVKFSNHVSSVEPLVGTTSRFNLGPTWEVESENLRDGVKNVETYDAVLVCVGTLSLPHIPEIEDFDKFTGTFFHSHHYRTPDRFTGQTVLMLGAKQSGIDISIDVSKVAKTVYLCHCNPGSVKTVLPDNVVEVDSGIKKVVSGDTVEFTNGDSVAIDALLFCTGYSINMPFMSPSSKITFTRGKIHPLYQHLINPFYPNLAFLGICHNVCPFPLFDQQARAVYNVLTGFVTLPSTENMIKWVEDEDESRKSECIPDHHAHLLTGDLQWLYRRELVRDFKIEPLPPFVEEVYKCASVYRTANACLYRHITFNVDQKGDWDHSNVPGPLQYLDI